MDNNELIPDDIPTQRAFNAFTEMFKTIGTVAKEKGTRLVTIVAGISILIFVFIKHFILASANDRAVIDYIDLTLVICAVIIIAIGLLISSFEYKIYVDSQNKDKQMLFAKYKMELEYNIKRLEMTDFKKIEIVTKPESSPGSTQPPPG